MPNIYDSLRASLEESKRMRQQIFRLLDSDPLTARFLDLPSVDPGVVYFSEVNADGQPAIAQNRERVAA